MSVMLLSDKHIATLALALAHEVCKDNSSIVEETAQHLAKDLRLCNVRAYNSRYKEKKKCTKVKLELAYADVSLSFARALADCWGYNSTEGWHGKLLRDLIAQHLNTAPARCVWSI